MTLNAAERARMPLEGLEIRLIALYFETTAKQLEGLRNRTFAGGRKRISTHDG